MNISQPPQTHRYTGLVFGCALIVPVALGAGFLLMGTARESARERYEKLRPGMTLPEAQAALGDPGSDMPSGTMTRQYRYAHSEVFHPEEQGPTTAHYWKYRDGMIVARFNTDGIIVAKTFHQAMDGYFDEASRRPVFVEPAMAVADLGPVGLCDKGSGPFCA
jgi:hypothetical protein